MIAPSVRGRVCRKCGADEWRAQARPGHFYCAPCNRVRNAKRRSVKKDEERVYIAKYQRDNPERLTAIRSNSRARLAGVLGEGVTLAQWRSVLDGSLGLCAYCNEAHRLQMDHIEPTSRGGEHDIGDTRDPCLLKCQL
jgi:5-methylcytosine-specific restriction endonuclease McrA